MRNLRSRVFVLPAALLLSALACVIPGGPAAPDPAAVQTGVAAKLTELAGVTPDGGSPSATPDGVSPSSTPATAEPGSTPEGGPAPTVAPDPHRRIVFLLGGNVWIKDQDNPVAQLTTSGDAVDVILSDDGQRIAYRRQSTYSVPSSIAVINTDGSGDHAALTGDAVNALYPLDGSLFTDIYSMEFIPGSHRILITTRKYFDGPGLIRYNDVLQLDADTGAFTTLLAAGTGGDPYPSPDGTKMLIARPESVAIANIDGSDLSGALISFPSVITYSEYLYYPECVWRPDSGAAGVVIPSADPLAPSPTGAIWQINPSVPSASLLVSLDGQFMMPQAKLSPALSHVGYLQVAGGSQELYVGALSGGVSLHLASGNSSVVGWSTNGTYFAYYMDSPRAHYIGSLGGGTVSIGTNVMRLLWISETQFLAVMGNTSAWTIRLGDYTGALSDIAGGSGNIPALAADF